MQQNPYNTHTVINGTNMYPAHRKTRRDETPAQQVGEQIIFYTWLAGFTAIMLTITAAVIRKILK